MKRRDFSALALFALASTGAGAAPEKAGTAPASDLTRRIAARLRDIEKASRGQLGVQILDTATGVAFGHRADDRFLMCSTFKLLASALVLHRVDRGLESLDRRIVVHTKDLVAHSPVTEKRVGGSGMTLAELCEATITTSDNAAANLILASYGGPPAFTAFARTLGDTVTRLDATEPALNVWHGIDNTTSPRAMLDSLQRVALGDALAPASRDILQRWLRANTTGETRLKAGLPAGWTIGDKTGASDRDGSGGGSSNDIAVVWPPDRRAPLLVTAYLTRSRATAEVRNAALAQVGRLLPEVVEGLARR